MTPSQIKRNAVIAVSPLTGRVLQGYLNAARDAFVGGKRDVTSDVFRAIIELAEFHKGNFTIEGGGKRFEVTVKEEQV